MCWTEFRFSLLMTSAPRLAAILGTRGTRRGRHLFRCWYKSELSRCSPCYVGAKASVEIIRGKKALVTGAASGIGRAIALALAQEGADLFLVDIDEPHLRISARDAAALGSKVLIEVCDLSNPAQVSACTVACLAAFGRLDILVNCAGVVCYGHADEMTAEKWNAVMSVNLFAPI